MHAYLRVSQGFIGLCQTCDSNTLRFIKEWLIRGRPCLFEADWLPFPGMSVNFLNQLVCLLIVSGWARAPVCWIRRMLCAHVCLGPSEWIHDAVSYVLFIQMMHQVLAAKVNSQGTPEGLLTRRKWFVIRNHLPLKAFIPLISCLNIAYGEKCQWWGFLFPLLV